MDIDAIYYEKKHMEEAIQAIVDAFEKKTHLYVEEVQLHRVVEIGQEKGRIYKAEALVVL